MNEKEILRLPHSVVIDDRKSISLTGVKDVDSFDENVIVAVTSMGELTVKGENLHIGTLNVDTGEMSINGEINSLVYTNDVRSSSKGGFFSKVFR